MLPLICTHPDYTFTMASPPCPEGVPAAEWDPLFASFILSHRGKEMLRGTVALNQLAQVQAEVDKTIANHLAARRYNRSLAGLWNNYPVDWLWWLLHRLGFKYCAGGRSQTHIIHFFARSYFEYGVIVRWKGKAAGASLPWLFVAPVGEMMDGIEQGKYE